MNARIVFVSDDGFGTSLYRISDDRGWFEFELSHLPENAERRIGAQYGRQYGKEFASMAPSDFPEIFTRIYAQGGIDTALLHGVVLPTFDPENTWASMRRGD